jgi:Gas vesicle synthesis protein GvpL/GvpF
LYGIVAQHALPEDAADGGGGVGGEGDPRQRAAPSTPEGVVTVSFRGLTALGAEIAATSRPPWPPPDLTHHRSVVAAVFKGQAVVPVPPGVVFRRRSTLLSWLELHYGALSDAVQYLHGGAEARLRVRSQPGPADASDGGPAHRVALDLARDAGRAVRAWILTPRRLSGVTDGRDFADVSASFLVERSQWREFADAVAARAGRDPGLQLSLTGPWPPYDFVRLRFGG